MMMKRLKAITFIAVALMTTAAFAADPSATLRTGKPLKVYILVGQSNMQGTATDWSIPAMARDPATKHLYDLMMDENGKPRINKDVRIAAFSQKKGQTVAKSGGLTIGYGSALHANNIFGPEWAFGVIMHEHLKEPFLIIKTSWGGKDLRSDFRPPSAERKEASGHYYRLMVKHVNDVLADPGKYCPVYNPKHGYEIAGFVWFQGYNDMIAGGDPLYAATKDRPQFAAYSDLLAHFIRDVRKEFNAPNMPFVIGVIGTGGNPDKTNPFRDAMAAPAAMKEFKGNVFAVHTARLVDAKLIELRDRGWKWQKPAYDPEKKYRELAAKLKPLVDEQNEAKKIKDKAERQKKEAEIKAKMDSIIYTPEEKAYFAENCRNKSFHYDGSAKNYSRFGEAFAKALIEGKDQ